MWALRQHPTCPCAANDHNLGGDEHRLVLAALTLAPALLVDPPDQLDAGTLLQELLRAFVRYKHVDYYDPVLFTRTYDWMKARGLTEGRSDHSGLIVR